MGKSYLGEFTTALICTIGGMGGHCVLVESGIVQHASLKGYILLWCFWAFCMRSMLFRKSQSVEFYFIKGSWLSVVAFALREQKLTPRLQTLSGSFNVTGGTGNKKSILDSTEFGKYPNDLVSWSLHSAIVN